MQAPGLNEWRHSFALGSIDGRLYVAGGKGEDGGELASVEIFDPAVGHWVPGPEMPTMPAYDMASAVVGRSLIVIGGRNYSSHLDAVVAFDTASQQWSSLVPLPAGRWESRAAFLDGVLYVLGGHLSDFESWSSRMDGYRIP
jgi:hypothetical protein